MFQVHKCFNISKVFNNILCTSKEKLQIFMETRLARLGGKISPEHHKSSHIKLVSSVPYVSLARNGALTLC